MIIESEESIVDQQLLARLNRPITRHPYVSRDGRGETTFGTDTLLYGFIIPETKIILNFEGEEITSVASFILNDPNGALISTRDEVTLPAPFNQRAPIQLIAGYQSLNSGLELVQVYV